MTGIDVALLMLRLWAGIVIIAHGVNHARTLEGTARWFEKVGFRSPDLNARLSAGNEVAIGLALIAGLLTSAAAAGLAATMLVAFWSIHRFAGFFVFHRPDEGYEYVATLTVAMFVLGLLGPGIPDNRGAVRFAPVVPLATERGGEGVPEAVVGRLRVAGHARPGRAHAEQCLLGLGTHLDRCLGVLRQREVDEEQVGGRLRRWLARDGVGL